MSNDDKNTSDLRRLLQEKLANSEAEPDAWNVPSGGVWSGISEELNAAKPILIDTRKPVWPWLVIGLMLAAFLMRECSHYRAVSQMEREMIQFQRECEEKLSHRNNNRPPANNNISPMAMGASPVAYMEPKQPTKHPKSRQFPSFETKGRSINNNLQQINATSNGEFPIAASVFAQKSDSTEFSTTPDQVLPLGALPYKELVALNQTKPRPGLNLPKPIIPKAAKPLALIGHAYTGLALTGNRLAGEKPSIISDQKALMGWQTGVGLEAVINRNWSVLTGLNYNISRIETDYNLAVPFTHNGEFQHDDGNYDNQYNHSLPSSLGNYPLQMVLTRASNATIHEGDVMGLELLIRQKTQFLSVPLQLRYGVGENKWQLGLRAGVVSNHVLAVASESTDLKSLHGAIHQRHTFIGAPKLADLEKWTFDYALGLDFRYQLSPRLALNMATGFQQGITPIYEDDALMNYLRATNLVVGFQYRLR